MSDYQLALKIIDHENGGYHPGFNDGYETDTLAWRVIKLVRDLECIEQKFDYGQIDAALKMARHALASAKED